MRISCIELDDFLANLDDAVAAGRRPFQGRIYVSKSHSPLNVEGTSVRVNVQASCVLPLDDNGAEGLLEFGYDCGINRTTRDASTHGSSVRDAIIKRLEEWAEKNGCKILPGLLNM